MTNVTQIPVGQLHPALPVRPVAPDLNPGLVAGVREAGVLTPLVVKADGTIIDGRLRRAAAVAAGLAEVPFLVLTPAEEAACVLDARMRAAHRLPTDPVEYARNPERTMAQHNLTTAERIGKSVSWVRAKLRLLEDQ